MMQFSGVCEPGAWSRPNESMKVAGADTLGFLQFDGYTEIVATAKGENFREVIGLDGPLAAAGRLSLKIQRHFSHGKRHRAMRAKQRSILVRRKYGC